MMDIDQKIDEVYRKIKDLEIQGAQSVSKESLKVLKEYVEEKGFDAKFDDKANKLKDARPTGVSAHNCIEYIKRERSIDAIDDALEYLKNAKHEAAQNASQLIDDGTVVMTHCHSSAVVETLKKAKDAGKDFKVFVTETRPKLQGIETARELVEYDIPIYYVVDSAAGLFMWSSDLVLVGIDSVKTVGVMNKIGTYLMALAANEDPETELYFVGSMDKFDYDNFSEIEERRPEEIISSDELDDPNMVVENPAFDLTPWSCIDGIITEKGIFDEKETIDVLTKEFQIY